MPRSVSTKRLLEEVAREMGKPMGCGWERDKRGRYIVDLQGHTITILSLQDGRPTASYGLHSRNWDFEHGQQHIDNAKAAFARALNVATRRLFHVDEHEPKAYARAE